MRRVLALLLLLINPIERLDGYVQQTVQHLRAPALEPPMRTVSNLGKPAVVSGALLAIALLDAANGVATARNALLVLVPVNLAVELIKRTVNRERPDGEHKRSNASFPSSHAANAFALALVFARRWRRWAPLFWLGAATIGFSRIYLNRHYLSDVVVGALIGLALAWITTRWIAPRSGLRPPGTSRP